MRILFILRAFGRNLLKTSHRRNSFSYFVLFHTSDLDFEQCSYVYLTKALAARYTAASSLKPFVLASLTLLRFHLFKNVSNINSLIAYKVKTDMCLDSTLSIYIAEIFKPLPFSSHAKRPHTRLTELLLPTVVCLILPF